MQKTIFFKKTLCFLFAMLAMLSLLSVTAAADGPEPGEVPFKVLALQLPNRGDQSAPAHRFLSLVAIPYSTPSSNYRLQVNRVEINEDNTLKVFIEIIDTGGVGLMVIGHHWAVLYVPLKYAWGTNGVRVWIPRKDIA